LLPQKSMLLPIADQYLRPKKEQLDEGQLRKWFFCVGLRGHYHGSVNSYANSDCDDLKRWAEDHDVPADVSGFTKRAVNGLDLRQANTREAAITGNSIMSLLIATGALDWEDMAIAVKDLKDDVELHHVVPAKRLKMMLPDGDAKNPIAGLTPITKSSNLRIGDAEPGTVIRDLDKQATQIMQSHKVDEQLLSDGYRDKASYEAFLKDREKQLKEMLVQTLGL